MFQTEVLEKIKTHILCSVICFRNLYRLWDNVEIILGRGRPQMTIKYGACTTYIAGWINKVANTHLEYVIFISFQYNNG